MSVVNSICEIFIVLKLAQLDSATVGIYLHRHATQYSIEYMGDNKFREKVQSHLERNGTIAGGKSINDRVCLFLVQKSSGTKDSTKKLVMSVSGDKHTVSKNHLSKLKQYQSKLEADGAAVVSQGGYSNKAKKFASNNRIDIINSKNISTTSGIDLSSINNPLSRRSVLVGACGIVTGAGYIYRDNIRPSVPPFFFTSEAKAAFADDSDVTVPEYTVSQDSPPNILLLTGQIVEENITVGDSIVAEIAVVNAGGRSFDSEYEIEFGLLQQNQHQMDTQTKTATVEPLNSGETSVITVGSFDLEGAGEWSIGPFWDSAIESEESAVQANEISVETHPEYNISTLVPPNSVNPGQWIELENGLRISAEITGYQQAIFYETFETWGTTNSQTVTTVRVSPSGHVYARINLGVENQTQGDVLIEDGDVEIDNGTLDSSSYRFVVDGTSSSLNSDDVIEDAQLSGRPIHSLSVPQGGSTDAWALTPVPVDEETEIQFEYSSAANQEPEYVIVMNSNPNVAEFELAELDVPDEWEEGEQELGVIVENTGESAGMFRGTIQRWIENEWITLSPPLEEEIQAGEQERTQVTVSGNPDNVIQFRVVPFDDEFEI